MIPSVFKSTRRAFLQLALAATVVAIVPAHLRADDVDPSHWVIEADQARKLLAEGALLIDARGQDLKEDAPLQGAAAVIWQDFTNPDLPVKGRLLADDAALTAKLQGIGLSKGVPAVVVADSVNGWGEDGRIVWTLRTLGHSETFLVNGGIAALLAEGTPDLKSAKVPGDFTVARDEDYEITKEQLKELIGKKDVTILDVREPREYAGETPYGESRGGHVPGAKHIFYKDLQDKDGRVLTGDALKERLAALGIAADTQVVAYCTGGIRSGFFTSVLNDAGYKARNYAGSMWEWSAQDPKDYPLVTE
ncbi:sulfurtransferase [Rhodobacter capsulatus]|uniref:sulfurtransferase n=1 Tax=Rhodobacter capsulatus TaxID=1061 RepID=UPI00042A43BB|nr:rhodanese-like domain-containing protein [Rhodobacter capsulatus]